MISTASHVHLQRFGLAYMGNTPLYLKVCIGLRPLFTMYTVFSDITNPFIDITNSKYAYH